MNDFYWNIDFVKCSVENSFGYEIEGWVLQESGQDVELKVNFNTEEKIPYVIKRKYRSDLKSVLKTIPMKEDAGFTILLKKFEELPNNGCTNLEIIAKSGEKSQIIYSENVDKILEEKGIITLEGNLDVQEIIDGKMFFRGWVFDRYGNEKIEVLDSDQNTVKHTIKRGIRTDVNRLFHLDEKIKCGFIISVLRSDVETKDIIIKISNSMSDKEYQISMKELDRKNSTLGKYIQVLGPRRFRENKQLIKNMGLREFRYHAILEMNRHVTDYDIYLGDTKLSENELLKQQKRRFEYNPLISIVIPLYNTPPNFLRELLNSVINQTYPNWQLCLADGSDNRQVGTFIKHNYGKEERISYTHLEENNGISENTNEAIAIAKGDFIMFSDHDDTIAKNALYEIVNAINENLETDIVYTDEDKVTMDGKTYYDPHFKPDFNLDLLRSNNYICHIFVVKKEIVDKIGLLRKEFDGAQDFDFILRCCEQAKRIKHIPKVLYHWRNHPASTAGNPASKMYAYEAGRSAIAAHYNRIGMDATVEMTKYWGRYRTYLPVHDTPLISIIIPNKDHKKDLKKCIDSIYAKSTYSNFEIIIVENNSVTKDIFEYYDSLLEAHKNISVITWNKGFNYSAINNFGVTKAKGDYLLLLNNDIEVKTENWMEEMLGYCLRDDVGAVGVKLLFEDEKIQHAGIVVGLGPSKTAGHVFHTFPSDVFTYGGKTQSTQDISAVTAACLMTKKSLYESIGGMDEDFEVAFNDVDFCLRLREADKLIVYNAFVEMYHYESITRGYEDRPENAIRFKREVKAFRKKWAKILKEGDPYYNPNLTKARGDCAVRS